MIGLKNQISELKKFRKFLNHLVGKRVDEANDLDLFRQAQFIAKILGDMKENIHRDREFLHEAYLDCLDNPAILRILFFGRTSNVYVNIREFENGGETDKLVFQSSGRNNHTCYVPGSWIETLQAEYNKAEHLKEFNTLSEERNRLRTHVNETLKLWNINQFDLLQHYEELKQREWKDLETRAEALKTQQLNFKKLLGEENNDRG